MVSDNKATCQCRRHEFNPWVGKVSWRRKCQPTPVFLPGEFPWTEGPGRLQSMGPQRVRHCWVTKQQQRSLLLKSENTWVLVLLWVCETGLLISSVHVSIFLLVKYEGWVSDFNHTLLLDADSVSCTLLY